nr:MAG TPA: hypothetical protein [Caudoviricetes sp.]
MGGVLLHRQLLPTISRQVYETSSSLLPYHIVV